LGEEVFGAEFLNITADMEKRINDYIAEETRIKQERDAAFLRKAKKPVDKPKRKQQDGDIDRSLRLLDDYPTELHPGDDYVLVLSQDENLIARVGKSLKRKYGVLVSKGRFSNVKQIIEHYDPALILIHQLLGQVDGFELCKTMKTHLNEHMRMVMMISEQDDQLAAKYADSQADDCVVVEPFKTLFFFKKIDEMLDLF
jgi:PleD family two-component response regulator